MNQAAPVSLKVDGHELSNMSKRIYKWTMNRLDFIQKDPIYLLVHGPAGNGKSLLLKAIRDGVRKRFELKDSVIVTAPTAMQAAALDSNTINHIFITWNNLESDNFLENATEQQMKHFEWMTDAKMILIDSINFVSNRQFATIDNRLRQIKGKNKPFGGLSVMVFGDFHQIPPVKEPWIFEDLSEEFFKIYRKKCPGSPENLWKLMKIVELNDIHVFHLMVRNDQLEKMRDTNGIEAYKYIERNYFLCWDMDQSKELIVDEFLRKCDNRQDKTFAILATSADIVNDINNEIVSGDQSVTYYPPKIVGYSTYCKKGNLADKHLTIAEGCPVVLTSNVNDLKHGSQGNVIEFGSDFVNVRFDSGVAELQRLNWTDGKNKWSQFPIRVAYAHTIERSQGMQFDGVILVRNKTWDYDEKRNWRECHVDYHGEIYTALSRASDLEDCIVTPLRFPHFDWSPKVEEELERMRNEL